MMAARVMRLPCLDEVPCSAPGPQVLPGSRLLGLRAAGISSIWCHQHVVIMQWVDGFLCRIPNPCVEYVSQFSGRATRKNAEMPSALSRIARWLLMRSALHVVLAPWVSLFADELMKSVACRLGSCVAVSPQLLAAYLPGEDDPRTELTQAAFLARAWRLANEKARELDWIV